MAQNYEELMTGACALLGFKEPQRLMAGEALYVNDVMFTFVHEEDHEPNRIFMFAGFGELPDDNLIPVLEELLVENYGFEGEGPGFAVSPTTGKVFYSRYIAIDEMSAEDLATAILYLAEKAKEWRTTFYLEHSAAYRPAAVQFQA